MHVVVENTVCLNTGDAAILLAIKKILEAAYGDDIKIYVFDSDPETSSQLYKQYQTLNFRKLLAESVFKQKYKGFPLKNRVKRLYNRTVLQSLDMLGRGNNLLANLLLDKESRQDIALYQSADAIITTGGTYLVENYNLTKRILQFRIDEFLGKAPIFFTQSLGPFDNSYNREHLTRIFGKSPLILLRDDKSAGHIADIVDDKAKCHVVADSVFALADTSRIENMLASPTPPAETGRVGVSVRNWNYVKDGQDGMRRYVDAVRQIVVSLVEQGKQVTFVSTCQGVPEYAHDDSKTAEIIASELAPAIRDKVTIDASFHTPDELMDLVKGFDFVVATRMHMMIMSLCVGIPVLPIAYEFKTKELAGRIGISDVLMEIDTISGDEATAKLARFTRDLDQFRRTSLEAVLRENASAMSSVELLKKALHR
ncbi:polysaccharide pyruvyl transferase family protein [Mesorhizobium sp. 1B3]|uniref:polysaccharide pyruvyl transferase family protein n=1 Tax=Mesorhizobium sp. 1B3 TaxID=3243599 RepID=UPI003D995CAB